MRNRLSRRNFLHGKTIHQQFGPFFGKPVPVAEPDERPYISRPLPEVENSVPTPGGSCMGIHPLKTHNPFLYGAMIVSLLLTTLVIEVPFLAAAFDFTPISLLEYAIALGLAVLIIPIMEGVKAIQRAMGDKA